MRSSIVLFILALSLNPVGAQILYLHGGKSYTAFDYKNSSGERLDNLNGEIHTGMGMGLRLPLFETGVHFSTELLLQEYGTRGSDPELGNYFAWNFTNAGTIIGLDYEFLTPSGSFQTREGFSFFVKTSFAAEYPVAGTRTLNNQITRLAGMEEFDRPFYFVRGGAGIMYYFTGTYYISFGYTMGRSFLIGNYAGREQLKLVTHNISIGVSVNLQEF